MKKILPILLLVAAAFMLSSCIIVAHEEPTYKFYFVNDSANYVWDWYLKDRHDENYAKSDHYCEVPQGDISSLSGLSEDDYEVWFCVYSSRALDVYFHTNWFELDDDTTFTLNYQSFYEGKPHYRAVTNSEAVSEDDTLVLIDSKGKVYPLYTAGE